MMFGYNNELVTGKKNFQQKIIIISSEWIFVNDLVVWFGLVWFIRLCIGLNCIRDMKFETEMIFIRISRPFFRYVLLGVVG